MKLEILICTIDAGIADVGKMLMPQREDVGYLVSWQQAMCADKRVPEQLQRSDVRVVTLEGRGLSRNRNNALKYATGDVCLIADDDCEYYAESLSRIVEIFEQDEKLDIATFKSDSLNDKKDYPDCEFDLRESPKGYYVTSREIAFRREAVQGRLQFNELFGLGAPVLKAGEEGVFVLEAQQMGMKCKYYPLTIVRHDEESTGKRLCGECGVVMSNAAYLYLSKHDDKLWLRAMLMAWRVSSKTDVSFVKALGWVIKGIDYAKRIIIKKNDKK